MSTMEGAADAIEFGGPWDASVMIENLESERCAKGDCKLQGSRGDRLCVSFVDRMEVEFRFLAEEGMPSHLDVTLGTVGGNFLLLIVFDLMELADVDDVFAESCLRCCSANCSKAA
jgi:hypothetical protein